MNADLMNTVTSARPLSMRVLDTLTRGWVSHPYGPAAFVDAARSAARDGGLGVIRQFAEAIALKVLRRQTLRYYFVGRFWRPALTWRDKCDHLNFREYDHVRNRLNGAERRFVYNNKLVQKALLRERGVPIPELLGHFHAEHGWDAGAGCPGLRDSRELEDFLRRHAGQTLAFKLVDGNMGRGFRACRVDDVNGELVLRCPATGHEQSVQQFAAALDAPAGYLVEAYVEQHPELAELHPQSVNTARIWVWRNGTATRFLMAYLRVGQAQSLVDNRHAGGLFSPIDGETGRVLEFRIGGLRYQPLELHPDTRVDIRGRRLPHWHAARALAARALEALPGCNIAGVDIAFAADGPLVVELNVSNPDQVDFAITDTPGRRALSEVLHH